MTNSELVFLSRYFRDGVGLIDQAAQYSEITSLAARQVRRREIWPARCRKKGVTALEQSYASTVLLCAKGHNIPEAISLPGWCAPAGSSHRPMRKLLFIPYPSRPAISTAPKFDPAHLPMRTGASTCERVVYAGRHRLKQQKFQFRSS